MTTEERPRSPRLRGVLFDVDNTLVDHDRAVYEAIGAHLATLGLPCGATAHTEWVRLEAIHYARYLAGELSFDEQRRERARGMVGRPLSDAEADRWIAGYTRRFADSLRPFPDVEPALDALAGLRLGVITNLDAGHQRAKLERAGLARRFRCVVGIDTANAAKPDPRIFHAGCEALELTPDEAAYVGDRLDVDALGAQRADLFGIWLDRAGTDDAPAGLTVVRSLTQLPGVLAGRTHPAPHGSGDLPGIPGRRRPVDGEEPWVAFGRRPPLR